ncbi:4439_t:CDS:2 [Paraglomus occultum]|uniref:4439_t:CDS:1 n=1 Tax=Paraglomus occultum TaxID=144539 RepID=A0A9N9F537_9GLOM|nr:4439_t:CDS:2 [Paraglomus occultum]
MARVLVTEDTKSYDELAKAFHYRLCLKRPIHPYIHLNMWYTMDLMLVSELGLYKKIDMDKVEGYSLGCEVLDIRSGSENNDFCVEVRPLSEEACEWSELTNIQWPGIHGGKGGLEFRVVPKKLSTNDDFCDPQCNNWRYLHIFPIAEMVKSDGHDKNFFQSIDRIEHYKIVPLLVGPIEIGHCYQHHSSCAHHQEPLNDLGDEAEFTDDSLSSSSPDSYSSNSSSPSPLPDSPQSDNDYSAPPTTVSRQHSWITDTYLVNNYRAFSLPYKKTLLIREVWDGRVSGKVWDSAFIVLQFMKEGFMKDRSFLFGKRILDLSTGTGLIGLYLASFCSVMAQQEATTKAPKTNIVLTDLQQAIKLINKNRLLNKYLINEARVSTEVITLEWGKISKARRLGTFDIVLASDVVYEPELFDVLIGTLSAVCTPNHTKIYLGYKRRALSAEEEGQFFKKLGRKFKVSLVGGADEQKSTHSRSRSSSRTLETEYLYKILVVGDPATGKTSNTRIMHTKSTMSSEKVAETKGVYNSTIIPEEQEVIQRSSGCTSRLRHITTINVRVCYKLEEDLDEKIALPDVLDGDPIPVVLLANKCDLVTEEHAREAESVLNKFCEQPERTKVFSLIVHSVDSANGGLIDGVFFEKRLSYTSANIEEAGIALASEILERQKQRRGTGTPSTKYNRREDY